MSGGNKLRPWRKATEGLHHPIAQSVVDKEQIAAGPGRYIAVGTMHGVAIKNDDGAGASISRDQATTLHERAQRFIRWYAQLLFLEGLLVVVLWGFTGADHIVLVRAGH